MIKRLVGLAGLLSSLSPFANCWIFHELLCFALNQHLFIIDDGDDDFNEMLKLQKGPKIPSRPVEYLLQITMKDNSWDHDMRKGINMVVC